MEGTKQMLTTNKYRLIVFIHANARYSLNELKSVV